MDRHFGKDRKQVGDIHYKESEIKEMELREEVE